MIVEVLEAESVPHAEVGKISEGRLGQEVESMSGILPNVAIAVPNLFSLKTVFRFAWSIRGFPLSYRYIYSNTRIGWLEFPVTDIVKIPFSVNLKMP
jgi:hypothetical protein